MDLRIDEKGKYFTARIAKNSVAAFVRTLDQVVVGYVHIRPDRRLKDDLSDDPSRFLPVTNAQVYDTTGKTLLFESSFLLIAYHHIIMISPLEAMDAGQRAAWQLVDAEPED